MCTKCIKQLRDDILSQVSRVKSKEDYVEIKQLVLRPNAIKCPAMKALEDLTPSGSEFVDDPTFCFNYIKNKIDSLFDTTINKQKQINSLRAAASIASLPGPLEVIDRICGNCAKTYQGTAYGLCNHCGRFQ